MKVGVYDSGLGGLTILKEAMKRIPAEYFYLADNKNTPYGVKDKNLVKKYIFENVAHLIQQDCQIIVIACNTATSIAISELRKKYPSICFIGTEPAVKKAVDLHTNQHILVCATTITLQETKLHTLIKNLHADEIVDFVALDKLVRFAENRKIIDFGKTLHLEVVSYLKDILQNYSLEKYGYVVLGCTHFPFFIKEFQQVFGKDVSIIDGTQGVVEQLKRKLLELDYDKMTSNKYNEKLTLIMTKKSKLFTQNFAQIIRNPDEIILI